MEKFGSYKSKFWRVGSYFGIGKKNPSAMLDIAGDIKVTQYKVAALNTAPTLATSDGVVGEIIIAADGIYLCTATNTWVKATLATF